MSRPPVLFLDKVLLSARHKPSRGVELFNLDLCADLNRLAVPLTLPLHPTWIEEWHSRMPETVDVIPFRGHSWAAVCFLLRRLRGRRYAVLLLGNVANRLLPLLAILRLGRIAPRCVLIAHRAPSRRALWAQRLWPTTVVAVNRIIAGYFERAGFTSVAAWYGIMHAERFHPAENRTPDGHVNFCVLGNLDCAWKGSDTAIRAFRALPPTVRRRCRLHLASFLSPPTLPDPDIVVYPWMDPGRVPDLLREMDVLLVPSRDEKVMRETFSQALVQGMLTGLPAIVSDLPVLTEKLDQGAGLIFRTDPELIRAMMVLAEDSSYRKRLGQQARATALARYVWDTKCFLDRFLFPAGDAERGVEAFGGSSEICDREGIDMG